MIKQKKQSRFMEIDLTGPQGNAFYLLGCAKDLARRLDMDPKPITEEMMSGDYEHLLEVFERNFGKFVILYR